MRRDEGTEYEMRLSKSRASHLSVIAFLVIWIALLASGCALVNPCPNARVSCSFTVADAGTYEVTYQDEDDAEQTAQIESMGPVLVVCGCKKILGEPVRKSSPDADLSVSIVDSPDPVSVGGTLTYQITVHNNGPFDATAGATVVDTLPLELTFVSVASSRANCNYATASRQAVCETEPIAAGADVEVTLITELSFAPLTAETKNAATVTLKIDGNVLDPIPENNTAEASTLVDSGSATAADLAVTMVDSPDPVQFGAAVKYTVTVTNNGPSTATGVVLTDIYPPIEINDSNVVVSQGAFIISRRNSTITCDLGTLPSGASATLTVTGFAFAHGTITNTAKAMANEPDPNPANNTAVENTTVN